MLILGNNTVAIQSIVTMLKEGMKINVGKTKIIRLHTTENMKVMAEGKEIQVVGN